MSLDVSGSSLSPEVLSVSILNQVYRLTPLPPTSLKLDVWGLGGPAGQMFASNGSSRLNYVNLLLGTWGPRGLNQLKRPAVGPYNN